MNELWIVPLTVACFVLVADMTVTYARKRLRQTSSLYEWPEEENLEGVAHEYPDTEPQ